VGLEKEIILKVLFYIIPLADFGNNYYICELVFKIASKKDLILNPNPKQASDGK
jgi:hypothetical protein